MKYVRILCAVALVFALCSAFTMKDKEKAVYALGWRLLSMTPSYIIQTSRYWTA